MAEQPDLSKLYGSGARTDTDPRCWRCKKLLARILTRPWSIQCVRCKAENSHP